MKHLRLGLLMFAAALLQACTTTRIEPDKPIAPMAGIPPDAKPCETLSQPIEEQCVIHLTVTDDGGTGCKITMADAAGRELLDLDQIALNQDKARGKRFFWRIINSPGYQFTDDGIAFIDNNRPRMYTNGRRLSDTEFQWRRNRKLERRVNGYVINVIKPDIDPTKERECERDPWVRSK